MALVARGEERYINERHITGGLPLVSQTSEGVQYHQHDHLGTTVASYSTDGAIISAYETTVFGQGELEDSRTARFTGKPYDADLGAYVFPFRNYDPESARWLSADPSGFPDGPNQHYYAAVPTMGVDPLGLAAEYYNQEVSMVGMSGMIIFNWRQFPFGDYPDLQVNIDQFFIETSVGDVPTDVFHASASVATGFFSRHSASGFQLGGSPYEPGTSSNNAAPEGEGWERFSLTIHDNSFITTANITGLSYDFSIDYSFTIVWER
jgi:RHS repeat-associated protein